MTPIEEAELRAELKGLRDLVDDRRAADKEAVAAALAAAEKAVNAALASAEKAADKFDQSLKEYKSSSNEWRGTLNDIVARMMPRADFEREQKALAAHIESLLVAAREQHKQIDSQIADLRESRSGMTGREDAVTRLTDQNRLTQRFLIGLAVTVILSVLWNLLK